MYTIGGIQTDTHKTDNNNNWLSTSFYLFASLTVALHFKLLYLNMFSHAISLTIQIKPVAWLSSNKYTVHGYYIPEQ